MRICSLAISVQDAQSRKDGGKQNPLEFEPRVRTRVEDFAYGRVGGGDENRNDDEPRDPPANARIDRVDGAAERQQPVQHVPPHPRAAVFRRRPH
jgi:hypothetical protein